MRYIFILLFFITYQSSFTQGCSDAGICSIGSSFDSSLQQKNSLEITNTYGLGKDNISYISPYITYTRKFSEKIAVTTKVTFSSATGNFGIRAAFGDAYLIGNYTFKEKNNKQWSVLIGGKFPFTSSNLKINNTSLPLDYQSSLGTFDLFLGTNLKYKKFDFNATIQIPVININKNSYFDDFSASNEFPTTNLFKRKPDALLRATYTLKSSTDKFTFKPNMLFIYHLGEDSFENQFSQRENIKNSDGLTVNANLITNYTLNQKSSLEFSLASPIIVRDIRPDGLTRSFVIGLSYRTQF